MPHDLATNAPRHFIGVDLGQARDATAIAVVRRVDVAESRPRFELPHIERLGVGVAYPAQVEHVRRLVRRPPLLGNSELVIDSSGVGRAVADIFSSAGLSFTGVIITGGTAETFTDGYWHVPKLSLVSRLQALLHEDRLWIRRELPEAGLLVSELQDFRVEYTASGHLTFNARSGRHDDLVLAAGLACWAAYGPRTVGIIEHYRREALGLNPGARAPAPEQIQLRAPEGTAPSHLHTITGRVIPISQGGLVEVSEEEAKPLITAGWTRTADSDAAPSAGANSGS